MSTSLYQTTALILAGGLGTRLRSVVQDRSKVMAEVLGRPFITFLLDQVARSGVGEVVLCTGYLADHVRDTLGDAYMGVALRYSREWQPLGTGGAVRLAVEQVRTERVLVLNGDSICPANLAEVAAAHEAAAAGGTMVLVHVTDTSRYGRVRLDRDGKVIGFEEKRLGAEPGMVNAGIYLIQTALLRDIDPGGTVSLEREVFPLWAGRGLLRGHVVSAPLLDIGTPESLAGAEAFLREWVAS